MGRNDTKVIHIGDRVIGGGNPILIQSMTNTKTDDVEATVAQINKLADAGCDIIRCAVPNMEAANALSSIKSRINIPLVADIHFDYKLAIAAIENGADKIRINPGNIGSTERIKAVVDAAKDKNIPIRVGVNSGSLEKEILEKHKKVCVDALVESAVKNVELFENEFNFSNIVVSIKSSNVSDVVFACRKFRSLKNFPLHIGVTEPGIKEKSIVKSSIAIGALLLDKIGETLRVSITGNPLEEVKAGQLILKSLGLIKSGVEIISCPTCARTKINIINIAKKAEKKC